jgi:DNA-binding Lrp family transcriptional regulator
LNEPRPLGKVDDLDRAILSRLRSNSRTSNAAIGQELELSEGAVRHRIARMMSEGTILRYTVITKALGPEGLVLIRCRPGATRGVVEELRRQQADLFETSGEYDLAAAVEASTMDDFNQALDRLRGIEGVESTATLVRLSRFVGGAAPKASAASLAVRDPKRRGRGPPGRRRSRPSGE